MKLIGISFITLILSLSGSTIYGQTWYRYDSNGNVIDGSTFKTKPGKSVELKDSLTGTRYVLDENHITITAIAKNGKVLWKTDPWKDNHISEYRTKRPIIIYFEFGKIPDYLSKRIKDSRGIAISYNNTQFGIVDFNGNFHFQGQD